MITDTHVHYNLDPLNAEWQRYWAEAQADGVTTSIVVGVNAQTNAKVVELVKNESRLFCTVGLHPEEQPANLEEEVAALEALAKNSKKVVAIGECGLDYFRLPADQPDEKRRQKELFGAQIELAKKLDLPLVIHCRDAYDDLLDTVHHFSMSDGKAPRAVLHCMSGTLAYLHEALKLGWYMSFAGNLTYKSAHSIRELAIHTPLDRLLVETDAPFLAPQSHRGNINEPKFITETVATLAELHSMTPEKMAALTSQNAAAFFRLPS
ncbi:MAG TPA: TatD family hydrolase [Candidatus Saccharimonadia bacterium]|nr:TatD family hydrolase [Candidatus Saccharimonadia bacterium]